MRIVKDQIGRNVHVPEGELQIVSLVPSQTELLFDLGLEEEVVGITKFCIHPQEWFKTKTRIGGTKNVNIQKVLALQPNLILANKEENTLADIEKLESRAPVWISDVRTIQNAHEMILNIGHLVGKREEAKILSNKIRTVFQDIKKPLKPYSVLYIIWNDPIMIAASDTFIDAMLTELGYANSASHLGRYPELTLEEVRLLAPDLIFLSSEPYPFKTKHIHTFQKILPKSKILLVDGELFSWYGSRLLRTKSLESLLDLQE
jgi:ABC-type Fe3+-hydroxamate transport system substrate-binding protein